MALKEVEKQVITKAMVLEFNEDDKTYINSLSNEQKQKIIDALNLVGFCFGDYEQEQWEEFASNSGVSIFADICPFVDFSDTGDDGHPISRQEFKNYASNFFVYLLDTKQAFEFNELYSCEVEEVEAKLFASDNIYISRESGRIGTRSKAISVKINGIWYDRRKETTPDGISC